MRGPGLNKTPSGGDNSCLGWTTDDRLYLIKVLYIQGEQSVGSGLGLNPIRPERSQTERGIIEFCESQHYDICIDKVSHDITPGSPESLKF